ncbi:hypothetical protein MIND_00837000 [Mycena indigotica]|uniref:Protein BZZ1 n=1 Tax=Mycena indigotica TaxID=2126181 RepID=A0A8H6SHH9_9AGAR|nr:uncharacterized protein MIND_00837000 [Mycena indigotica]KAF7298890.1 hypothetical protein MIND_00837000 [Mycena indigotica]
MGSQSFGQALPDQVECISSLFDGHLHLLLEVREIYRDRVAAEREYAAKLQALTKRATEKRAKLVAAFVVGDEPTKPATEATLAQNTFNAAFNEIISSMSGVAQDHVNLADALTTQVVDVLKAVERKNEELKKKETNFFQRLLTERDRLYADRLKAKQKYDDECTEVESIHQKQVRANDDRHADRAARQVEQQRADMLNSKNVYLISTAIANRVKTKFYNDDLPALEDQFQILLGRLTKRFCQILGHAQAIEIGHLEVVKGRLANVEKALGEVDPAKDQDIFIEHNLRPFAIPADWMFEPCAVHYDTDAISVEPAPKVFLQNKLNRARMKLKELTPVLEAKRRDQDQLLALFTAYDVDHSLGNSDDISENYLDTNHQVMAYTTSDLVLNTEITVISEAIGGDEGDQHPHSFKSSSFSIPTQCGYCKSSIWGLAKQGKTCRTCGLSVHTKCELKVPADCQHPSMHSHKSTGSTVSKIAPQTASVAPTPSAFAQSVAQDSEAYEETYQSGRVLFDFAPTSEFELAVSEGATVHVIEPDDGSGWVKVSDGRNTGLVPASYIDYSETVVGPTASGEGSGEYVRAIYTYAAQGSDEIGLSEGELLELTTGPEGGKNYGDGWWEGVNSAGNKGIFPSNYVQMA